MTSGQDQFLVSFLNGSCPNKDQGLAISETLVHFLAIFVDFLKQDVYLVQKVSVMHRLYKEAAFQCMQSALARTGVLVLVNGMF